MVEAYPPRYVERFYVRYQEDGLKQVKWQVEKEEHRCIAMAPDGIIDPRNVHYSYGPSLECPNNGPRFTWVDGDKNGHFSDGDQFSLNEVPIPAWTMKWARGDFERALGRADQLLSDTAQAVGAALTIEPPWFVSKAQIMASTVRPTGWIMRYYSDVGVMSHPSRAAATSAKLYRKRDCVDLIVPPWGVVEFDETPYSVRGASMLEQASNDRLLVVVDHNSPAERTHLVSLFRYLDQYHTENSPSLSAD